MWAFIQHLGAMTTWDAWVGVGHAGLRARLLVQARCRRRWPTSGAATIRKEARDKGRSPSAAALALAAYTILITNAPSALLRLDEALVLAKVRWQIELLFKLWKSYGFLGRAPAPNSWYHLCAVYAQLIAMLLQHWVLVVSCWRYPDHSLVKAAQVVRDHATDLASAPMNWKRIGSPQRSHHPDDCGPRRASVGAKTAPAYLSIAPRLDHAGCGDIADFNH
ncbi:MAG: transposase [Kouleothrix sp.]